MPKTKTNKEEPKVPFLQILDENGKLDADLDPRIPDDELLRIYRFMRLTRAADDRMLNLQRQGRIGTFAPCTGQEATMVTAACAMTDDDWFAGSFREFGARLVLGEEITSALVYYNGFEEGNVTPEAVGGRLLPINIIIASQMLQAVGIAYAKKYRGEDGVVVAMMGDGATSQGDFHEALNFASVWNVPVVFVIQNNQWAISMPRSKQTHSRTLAQKAGAYDMPGVQVDGNDVLSVYAAVTEAMKRARSGEGPTLIEAVTYRLKMHTTADDPRKYRTEEEEAGAWAREPLIRFSKYLQDKGLWDEEKEAELTAENQAKIEAAVEAFESMTDFKPDAPFDHVYGSPHPEIERQRREFLDDLREEEADA